MEDSKIVDLYLARDETAIVRTSEKYGKKLKCLAKNICGDDGHAQECENDTYLGAWRSIPPHEPRHYLLAFLYKITRALALDRVKWVYRKKRSALIIELSKEIEDSVRNITDVESEIEAKLLREAINDFLRKQPEEKSNIFIHRYWYMDSIEQIADRYSMTNGKVKSILFRMRNSLKDHLTAEGFNI